MFNGHLFVSFLEVFTVSITILNIRNQKALTFFVLRNIFYHVHILIEINISRENL